MTIIEREREREQLQQSITNLTNKPNKTLEEQTELEKLKAKLKDLEQKDKNDTTAQPTKDNKINPFYILVPIGLVVVGLISLVLLRKKKKEPSSKAFW